jgi:undecaprenyl-diphosphatase
VNSLVKSLQRAVPTRWARRAVGWVGQQELVVLIAALLVVGGTWGFIALSDEVMEGETQHFDERLLIALRQGPGHERLIGPAWTASVARDITALGSAAVLTLAVVFVAGFLLMRRAYHAFWLVVVASFGGMLLSTILKNIVERGRPTIVPRLQDPGSASFPSGHSMLAAVVYLTLGALLARLAEGPRAKAYILTVAMLLTGMVGVSRLCMGVHYPTDVLAGWIIGLAWALLCWLVARMLQRRGKVESVDELPADTKTPG